jgi:hypothetical protein
MALNTITLTLQILLSRVKKYLGVPVKSIYIFTIISDVKFEN